MYRDEIITETRIFSPAGERLYCTADERARFLSAAQVKDPIERMFCQVLHYTGCRPCEAIELAYERILIDDLIAKSELRLLVSGIAMQKNLAMAERH